MKETTKNMELNIASVMKKNNELVLKLKQTEQVLDSVRNDRNILSKNVQAAKVTMPFCSKRTMMIHF